ncbi:hypothetical protein MKX01_015481 [Papaver californicum]|nr:hypothetical protein MKX01_015481 [Papaver californicum]
MVFLSPLGLGARLIGSRRRRPQRHSRVSCVKAVASPGHGRKRKQMEEETREKKKKKKSRGNGCCDKNEVNVISNTFSSISIFNLEDDDVVREILSRLPVGSLMRFKCVCRYWLYLTQEDPSFADQYLEPSKRRPGLLITNLKDTTFTLMTADLLYEGKGGTISAAAIHTIREIDGTCYDRMLGPANGLIGFYGETIPPGVCICNLSTREVTPWIESKPFRNSSLALGYDPATKEHKVVDIWSFDRPKKVVCEVLTVGDNEWRKTDEVPPFHLHYWAFSSSVYVNGSIYYTTLMLMACAPRAQDVPKFIVAFNVLSEKFRAIELPNQIFDRPAPGVDFCVSYSVKLYELDGRVALLVKLLDTMVSPPGQGCGYLMMMIIRMLIVLGPRFIWSYLIL